jgi:hypothetical protein
MNYRNSEILADESIAVAGTKTIDINLSDAISRLTVQVKATNSTSTPIGHPALMVSKIEIVDGSNVVFSMRGIGAQALDFYDTGISPHNAVVYHSGVQCIALYNLNFGRGLYDEVLALDPKRFNNLQLKISHSMIQGGSTPSAATMRIRADVFDGKVPSLQGFLCSKEHYSFPDESGGIVYVDMPTDYALRKMLIVARADSKAPFEQISQVKLSEEQDKKVVFEGYQSDFIKHLTGLWPLYHELLYGESTAAGVGHFVTPTVWSYLGLVPDDVTPAYLSADITSGQKQTIYSNATVPFRGVVQGYCPHGAVAYPFGKQSEIADWYDVTQLRSLRLKLTQGSSVSGSETIEVITQQLRPY